MVLILVIKKWYFISEYGLALVASISICTTNTLKYWVGSKMVVRKCYFRRVCDDPYMRIWV
jgi:hypothetical protein